MDIEKLEGLIAAPFTPMDSEGHLNLDMVGPYAEHLLNNGIAGAFVCGTTGEGVSLTLEERKRVLEEWLKNTGGKLKVKAHVGGNCLSDCRDLAAHAQKAGAYSVASFAPNFYKPSVVKDLVSFLASIAASAPDLPFYFYHIPSMTGVNLPVSDIMVEASKRIPNFAGVKFTHFDLYDMQKCLVFGDGQYNVLHGYDETLLCGLSLGIKSAIGSTYNYMASAYLHLWEAFDRSDMAEAREWQQLSVRMVNILNKFGGGVRAGKAIMGMIGIDCGPCRLPIRKLTREELVDLKSDLDQSGFFKLHETGVTYI